MKAEFEPLATRHAQGRNKLIDHLQEFGGIDREDATKVADLYVKNRIVKLSVSIGQYAIKHGAFLDRDTILNAVEMARNPS